MPGTHAIRQLGSNEPWCLLQRQDTIALVRYTSWKRNSMEKAKNYLLSLDVPPTTRHDGNIP